MASIIGSDYSSGVIYLACVEGQKVRATASLDITNLAWAIPVIKGTLRAYQEEFFVEDIWIEEAWVSGIKFPKSGLMLSRTSGILEVLAIECDLITHFVHPMTWRKEIYGHAKPSDAKETSRKYVLDNFNFETKYKKDHNIAEAILVAHYGNIQVKNSTI